jgi:trehalose utilization protein
MAATIRATVWNEFVHEKVHDEVKKVYPHGIHVVIGDYLNTLGGVVARGATLEEPEHGLTEKVLAGTDVLIWWGHLAHDKVNDAVVERVQTRVLQGMGLIVLHSGHMSKIFRKLMGTTCLLKWREAGEREILWVTAPGHPIVAGIDDHIVLANEEMYGEHFDVPEPQETVLISSFAGGEVFRSGCTWRRGGGKIFYFRPGHETHPTYFHPDVQKVLGNAVRWAAPCGEMKFGGQMMPTGWFEKK